MFFLRTRKTCPNPTQQHEIQIRQYTVKQKTPTCWKSWMINNLTSIHFNYQRINMILSKWVLVQNQNSRIKFHQKLVIDTNKL
jgi:hypothetical protein